MHRNALSLCAAFVSLFFAGAVAQADPLVFVVGSHPTTLNVVPERNHERIPQVDLGGRKALTYTTQDVHGHQVVFKITDDSYKDGGHASVVITLDYFDKGTGTLTLQYDSLDDAPDAGAFKKAGSVTLADSNTWKTATFTITDARFDDRCNDADFRVEFHADTEFDLGGVTVAPGTAAPTIAHTPAPRGRVIEGVFEQSTIYPGTTRKYAVYIPAQYDATKPACVYIGQDGLVPKFASELNHLIADKKVPVMVGIFIQSGTVMPPTDAQARRANRCVEYDSLGDTYVRFLLEEMIPFVAKTYSLNLSNDPNDRCIGGGSSGGICAFNAAWERPDAFRRVYSISGSFSALRGGEILQTYVRKYEPRPIRAYLHVGLTDMVDSAASWYLANQEMDQALTFSNYDYRYETSEGDHMVKYTDAFPDAMAWLWRDYPAPIVAGPGSSKAQEVILPNEAWKEIGAGFKNACAIASGKKGEIYIADLGANKIYIASADDKPTVFAEDAKHVNALAVGPDGVLYGVSEKTGDLVSFSAEGKAHVVASDLPGRGLAIARDGTFYITSPGAAGDDASKVWLVTAKGVKKTVDTGLKGATGAAISADGWLLNVSDSRSHWVYNYTINTDGTLANKEAFHWLTTPDVDDESGADGLAVDQKGIVYVASYAGIQVEDLQGHNRLILNSPGGRVNTIAFGGPDFDLLYAACGDKVYARKVKVRGAEVFLPASEAKKGGPDLFPAGTAATADK